MRGMDHTARSAAVIVFIAAVAAAAIYCAQRPTVARGDVLAAQLIKSNPRILRLECDPEVPIGVAGAVFECVAHFATGTRETYKLGLDRDGNIGVVNGDRAGDPGDAINKTGDPWAD